MAAVSKRSRTATRMTNSKSKKFRCYPPSSISRTKQTRPQRAKLENVTKPSTLDFTPGDNHSLRSLIRPRSFATNVLRDYGPGGREFVGHCNVCGSVGLHDPFVHQKFSPEQDFLSSSVDPQDTFSPSSSIFEKVDSELGRMRSNSDNFNKEYYDFNADLETRKGKTKMKPGSGNIFMDYANPFVTIQTNNTALDTSSGKLRKYIHQEISKIQQRAYKVFAKTGRRALKRGDVMEVVSYVPNYKVKGHQEGMAADDNESRKADRHFGFESSRPSSIRSSLTNVSDFIKTQPMSLSASETNGDENVSVEENSVRGRLRDSSTSDFFEVEGSFDKLEDDFILGSKKGRTETVSNNRAAKMCKLKLENARKRSVEKWMKKRGVWSKPRIDLTTRPHKDLGRYSRELQLSMVMKDLSIR